MQIDSPFQDFDSLLEIQKNNFEFFQNWFPIFSWCHQIDFWQFFNILQRLQEQKGISLLQRQKFADFLELFVRIRFWSGR